MESKALEREVKDIRKAISGIGGMSFPMQTLKFKKSSLTNVLGACVGYDGLFYMFDGNVLKGFSDIKNDGSVISTGINWNVENYGTVRQLAYLPEGFLVFTNYTSGTYQRARIYHLADINANPTLVYQSSSENADDFWSGRNGFGVKTYNNGLTSYVLAGVYGRGQSEKDLLLSKDGGKTFSVIKKTINADTSGKHNSHWHDVAFDVYSGLIWASEGDDTINQRVYYSDDFGQNWTTVSTNTQPTTIIPFPDRVVFGRDSNVPGLDYLAKSTTISGLNNMKIEPLYEFKTRRTHAFQYYAKSPISNAAEAYMAFDIFIEQQPRIILGTGDFGKSWHSVYMGETAGDGSVDSLIGMDEEYIYAYGGSNSRTILYAKKPIWIKS